MFDYLQQFNKLPQELRERVSSPAVMDILSDLEKKYGLSLAMIVMRVMIKQIPVKDMASFFISEFSLDQAKAEALSSELKDKIFFSVASYLGLKEQAAPLSLEERELQDLFKDAGFFPSSQDLLSRARQIILTYRKGVRTKIDARSALERPLSQGGVGLDATTADRLLKLLDGPVVLQSVSDSAKPNIVPVVANDKKNVNPIDELIKKNESAAYDFKAALAAGKVKAPAALADKFRGVNLNTAKELPSAPKKQILEAPDKLLAIAAPSVSKSIKPSVEKPAAEISLLAEIPAVKPQPAMPEKKIVKAEIKNTNVEPIVKNEEPVKDIKPLADAYKPLKKAPGGIWNKLFKDKPAVSPAGAKINAEAAKQAAEQVKELTRSAAAMPRQAAASEVKTKMEDVKAKPIVMGPLDELRLLDLVNFRRLSKDPKEACEKIVMKIKLLEREGYDKMVEGVRAWRQSQVNRFYVRLAQDAVASGITIREAVAARQAENKETLNMEEIEAVIAMNSRLMF